VKRGWDISHYSIMLVLSASGAAVVWTVFRGVYQDLSVAEKAVGYVDPMTATGTTLGYYVMLGGSLALATVAVWSAFQILRLLLQRRR
jgi:hypothetical protein